MQRREFMALLGGALTTWPGAASAQTAGRLRRIGILSTAREGDAEGTKRLDAFSLRLQELGWTEGKTSRSMSVSPTTTTTVFVKRPPN
jgi:hypothetical protein